MMQSLFVSLFILFTFIFSNGRSRYLLVKLDNEESEGMFFTKLYLSFILLKGICRFSYSQFFIPLVISFTATGTKQEGEVCGSCFSADTNFDCGKCIDGLECVKDPRNELLPDVPSRCARPNIGSIQPF